MDQLPARNPGGRPPCAPLDLKQAEQLAARGLSMSEITTVVGLGTRTVFRHQRRQPKVREAIARRRAKGVAAVANALYEAALRGNIRACIFYLKARAGWRDTARVAVSREFGPDDAQQVEVSGRGGAPLTQLKEAFRASIPEDER